MSEISLRFKIIKEFCRKELFGDATQLIESILLNDDDHKLLELPKTYQDKFDELEKKEEELSLNEPDQYYNYDAWMEWNQKCLDIETDKDTLGYATDMTMKLIGEWWLCTEWLGKKLEEKNEFVLYHNGFAVWGRTEYGYDPCLDPLMREIASDIEILPGQKYDWSKFVEGNSL